MLATETRFSDIEVLACNRASTFTIVLAMIHSYQWDTVQLRPFVTGLNASLIDAAGLRQAPAQSVQFQCRFSALVYIINQ